MVLVVVVALLSRRCAGRPPHGLTIVAHFRWSYGPEDHRTRARVPRHVVHVRGWAVDRGGTASRGSVLQGVGGHSPGRTRCWTADPRSLLVVMHGDRASHGPRWSSDHAIAVVARLMQR